MTLKSLILGLLLLTQGVILSGCGKSKDLATYDAEEVNEITKARKLLNEKQYDAAIEIYEREVNNFPSPTREELIVELASAYAMKAGVDIYSLFPIIKMELFRKPIINWNGSEGADSLFNPYRRYLEHFILLQDSNLSDLRMRQLQAGYDLIWKFFKFSQYLFLVPHIPRDTRAYLKVAEQRILPLARAGHSTAKVYLALLSTVHILNYVKDAVPRIDEAYQDYLCEIQFNLVFHDIESLLNLSKLLQIAISGTKLSSQSIQTIANDLEVLGERILLESENNLEFSFNQFSEAICN